MKTITAQAVSAVNSFLDLPYVFDNPFTNQIAIVHSIS
jgi:hypothetical protein